MTVDAGRQPQSDVAADEASGAAEAFRTQGFARMRAGAPTEAIELFRQASALEPGDPRTLLGLGIALQAAKRHEESLDPLERAQTALPEGPLAFLHAAMSLLALGRAEAALAAANEAGKRAPQLAEVHSARGQAFMALDEPARAEEAFMAALERAPRSADVWVLAGVARFRQGALDRAAAAMREALRIAPDHATAKANLATLESAGGAPDAVAPAPRSSDAGQAESDAVALAGWKPADPAAALGLAVEYLIGKPAFARLPFGEWSRVLLFQVARGHYLFVVDPSRRVLGFLGWALTSEAAAETWLAGRSGLRDDECRAGDCVIVNAFAADTPRARAFLVAAMRGLFGNKRNLYFKRHYRDGRTRPMRLSVNDFVAAHLAGRPEASAVGDAGAPDE